MCVKICEFVFLKCDISTSHISFDITWRPCCSQVLLDTVTLDSYKSISVWPFLVLQTCSHSGKQIGLYGESSPIFSLIFSCITATLCSALMSKYNTFRLFLSSFHSIYYTIPEIWMLIQWMNFYPDNFFPI